MANDIAAVTENVRRYCDEVRSFLPVVRAVMLEPYAWTSRDHGFAQVFFVLKDFGGRKWYDLIDELIPMGHKYNLWLEVMPFTEEEVDDEDSEELRETLAGGTEV